MDHSADRYSLAASRSWFMTIGCTQQHPWRSGLSRTHDNQKLRVAPQFFKTTGQLLHEINWRIHATVVIAVYTFTISDCSQPWHGIQVLEGEKWVFRGSKEERRKEKMSSVFVVVGRGNKQQLLVRLLHVSDFSVSSTHFSLTAAHTGVQYIANFLPINVFQDCVAANELSWN